MNSVAAVILVGPSETEVKRLGHLLESLFFYEPGVQHVVMVDDAPQPRALDALVKAPATCQVISLPGLSGNYDSESSALGLCAPLLTALDWLERHSRADFIIKLDTDALVIEAFADKIGAFFASHQATGMVGAYRMTPNGELRCFADWGKRMTRLSRFVQLSDWRPRRLKVRLNTALTGARAQVRRHIQQALANGYEPGEHCLGGAYALSMALLRSMRARGYLNPLLWRGQPVAEDVMMGMYTRACGMELADLVHRGAPFGIRYVGLADSPEKLVARGFSIIHSLKNDQHMSEDDLYAFFKRQRKASLVLEESSRLGVLTEQAVVTVRN